MGLADEKYLLLTTFKRSGDPVATPIWIVGLHNGTYGFWTSSGSGKAKRLAHTERVTLQPCDARGKITAGSAVSTGAARFADDAELGEIRAKVVAKYGFMTKVTKLLNTIGGIVKRKRIPYGDRGVVITVG
jgi:PPOX class probable F420-dependent enzyme